MLWSGWRLVVLSGRSNYASGAPGPRSRVRQFAVNICVYVHYIAYIYPPSPHPNIKEKAVARPVRFFEIPRVGEGEGGGATVSRATCMTSGARLRRDRLYFLLLILNCDENKPYPVIPHTCTRAIWSMFNQNSPLNQYHRAAVRPR